MQQPHQIKRRNMLRFVTQKFRTQSLNEVDQPFQYKSDDDRDSGTESDDENTEFEDSQENVDNTQSATFGDDSPATNGSVYLSHRPSSGAPPCCEESNHGDSGVVHHRRRVFARRSMDTSISSCHSTNSVSSNAILMANGNSSDADDYGALVKQVPSPILAMLDVDSALPSDSDHFEHHSSEEELEVINSSRGGATSDEENQDAEEGRRKAKQTANSNLTTGFKLKYKCSDPSPRGPGSPGPHQKSPKKLAPHEHHHHHHPPQTYHPEKRKWSQANRRSFGESSAGSSDDEVRDLMCSPSAPVEFRTSPPAELLRPTRSTAAAARAASLATLTYVVDVSGGNVSYSSDLISTSAPTMLIHGPSLTGGHPARPPPTKLFHFSSSNFTPFEVCTVSPRKRHRQMTSAGYHHHHPYHPVPCHAGGDSDAGPGNSPSQLGTGRNSSGHPVQRPCLDFEKMQQMRDRAVSGWRTTRELSLIC